MEQINMLLFQNIFIKHFGKINYIIYAKFAKLGNNYRKLIQFSLANDKSYHCSH